MWSPTKHDAAPHDQRTPPAMLRIGALSNQVGHVETPAKGAEFQIRIGSGNVAGVCDPGKWRPSGTWKKAPASQRPAPRERYDLSAAVAPFGVLRVGSFRARITRAHNTVDSAAITPAANDQYGSVLATGKGYTLTGAPLAGATDAGAAYLRKPDNSTVVLLDPAPAAAHQIELRLRLTNRLG